MNRERWQLGLRPDGFAEKPLTRFLRGEVARLDTQRHGPRRAGEAAKKEAAAINVTPGTLPVFCGCGKLSGGMAAAVHFLKLADVDLGINRRRFQLLMAEQLLDIPDVLPAFEHVRRARVPQHVAAPARKPDCA